MVDQDEHPAMVDRPVYLDYNATTPVDPRVLEAMQTALTTDFGNPPVPMPTPKNPAA